MADGGLEPCGLDARERPAAGLQVQAVGLAEDPGERSGMHAGVAGEAFEEGEKQGLEPAHVGNPLLLLALRAPEKNLQTLKIQTTPS